MNEWHEWMNEWMFSVYYIIMSNSAYISNCHVTWMNEWWMNEWMNVCSVCTTL